MKHINKTALYCWLYQVYSQYILTLSIYLMFSILFASCAKFSDFKTISAPKKHKAAYSFQMVSNNYALPPLVNKINPPEYINAIHYTFRSPKHDHHEIGFSMITSKQFKKGNNRVYIFLHGQGGTEGSGLVNYIPSLYRNDLLADDAVYFLLNGITDTGGSWEIKDRKGYHPIHTIREFIDGIYASKAFNFLSEQISDWTLIGFSMGGRAAMSVALNPEFRQWNLMPSKIYPMGCWLSADNLNEMIDFETSWFELESFIPQTMQLTVINHILDSGDNALSLKVDVSDPFISRLNDQGFEIANIHLTQPRPGCTPNDPQIGDCHVHKVNYYYSLPDPTAQFETIGELVQH